MTKNIKKWTLFFIITSTLTSCIEDPAEEVIKAASPEQLQLAFADAWGEANPLTMEPGDFLFQETEQKIESDPNPFFVLQEGITISKKEETATDFLYTFLYQNRALKRNQEPTTATREDHRTVSKPTPAITALDIVKSLQTQKLKTFADDYQMTLGFERLYGLAFACIKSDPIDRYCKEQLKVDSCDIQCSNLNVTESVIPAPDLIKAQPNCGGLVDCTLHTKKVAFDWTISLRTGKNVEKQRVNYSVTLSPDLPFFSRMTEFCYRQLFSIQNQKVLVNTCTKLRNFQKAGS